MSLILFLFFSCDRESLYPDPGLYENVQSTLQDCSKADIEFLKRSYNIQTAFSNCGSNQVQHFSWSPNGDLLYFQLLSGVRILNGQNKTQNSVPVEKPTFGAAWVHNGLLAIPEPQSEDGNESIAWYQIGGIVTETKLSLKSPQDLQSWSDQNVILFTALNEQNQRFAYRLSSMEQIPVRVFETIEGEIDHISYAMKTKTVSVLQGKKLTVYVDGKALVSLDEINRSAIHPDGRYLALEVTGQPISVIKKNHGRQLDVEQTKRENERIAQLEKSLPDWADKHINPSEIHILDLKTLERYRFTKFFGSQFEWYKAKNYYASMLIEGINKQLINQNVGLLNLGLDLIELSKGDTPSNVERMGILKPISN